jgi:hypothetical protein
MNEKVPERLYRYRALGGADYDKYLESILTKARLYFPSRAQINDPSHYTSGHRGVCLEFESGLLGFSRPIRRIQYLDFLPEFDPSIEGEERTRRLILSKYEGWSYEKEWRVIYGAEKRICFGEHPFDPKSLSAIVFGCATTEQDKDKVRKWVKNGPCKPEFRQAVRRKGAFAIDIKSL